MKTFTDELSLALREEQKNMKKHSFLKMKKLFFDRELIVKMMMMIKEH
jgi:hypothetical protein